MASSPASRSEFEKYLAMWEAQRVRRLVAVEPGRDRQVHRRLTEGGRHLESDADEGVGAIGESRHLGQPIDGSLHLGHGPIDCRRPQIGGLHRSWSSARHDAEPGGADPATDLDHLAVRGRAANHGVSAHHTDKVASRAELVQRNRDAMVVQPLAESLDRVNRRLARSMGPSVDLLVDRFGEFPLRAEPAVELLGHVQSHRRGVVGEETEVESEPVDHLVDLVGPVGRI